MPGWRGRWVFRSLLALRAALAAARGYPYLQVDASPDSRPILKRLGFTELATTTTHRCSADTVRCARFTIPFCEPASSACPPSAGTSSLGFVAARDNAELSCRLGDVPAPRSGGHSARCPWWRLLSATRCLLDRQSPASTAVSHSAGLGGMRQRAGGRRVVRQLVHFGRLLRGSRDARSAGRRGRVVRVEQRCGMLLCRVGGRGWDRATVADRCGRLPRHPSFRSSFSFNP